MAYFAPTVTHVALPTDCPRRAFLTMREQIYNASIAWVQGIRSMLAMRSRAAYLIRRGTMAWVNAPRRAIAIWKECAARPTTHAKTTRILGSGDACLLSWFKLPPLPVQRRLSRRLRRNLPRSQCALPMACVATMVTRVALPTDCPRRAFLTMREQIYNASIAWVQGTRSLLAMRSRAAYLIRKGTMAWANAPKRAIATRKECAARPITHAKTTRIHGSGDACLLS